MADSKKKGQEHALRAAQANKRTRGRDTHSRILHAIAYLYSQKVPEYKPSIPEIKKAAGLTDGNIDYALARLQNAGMVHSEIKKEKRVPPYSSRVTVLAPSGVVREASDHIEK